MNARFTTEHNIDAAIVSSVVVLGCLRTTRAQELSAPETVTVTGIVRDFRERTDPNGHPDFQKRPDHGFGLYAGNVDVDLGDDGKPVFTGYGRKVTKQPTDSAGRPISFALYDPDRGDQAGTLGASDTGAITSADTFNQWYRDKPGVNISAPLELTFVRQSNGHYVFDDREDPHYSSLGGFFPIEDQLFGNPGGNPDRNFHFTFELHVDFIYDSSGDQFFKFIGDDDVWVFVNGKLCIDLGGVHAATEQYIDMNRLGLVDGESYTIDFFFAERHRTQSNCRIETNLALESHALPAITAVFD